METHLPRLWQCICDLITEDKKNWTRLFKSDDENPILLCPNCKRKDGKENGKH